MSDQGKANYTAVAARIGGQFDHYDKLTPTIRAAYDPDRNECGCDGPCNGGERPAPELAAAVAESRRYLEALQVARSFLLDPGSSGRRRAIAAISKALEGK